MQKCKVPTFDNIYIEKLLALCILCVKILSTLLPLVVIHHLKNLFAQFLKTFEKNFALPQTFVFLSQLNYY